ncbi:DPP IV N-terminal domain-containing protein [Nocardioides taihuensis]|uniref:DPP IV N-terminal domain-containing protein n=1 Tax=Nocardioides taihuensis TaxID=1835606 RepID=A0ABW0BN49_9ACTN
MTRSRLLIAASAGVLATTLVLGNSSPAGAHRQAAVGTTGGAAAHDTHLGPTPTGVSVAPGQGGRIAFTRGGRLFVMGSDGSGAVDITPTCEAFEPAWSPDATMIAFIHRCGPSGTFDLAAVEPDGSNMVTLVATGTDEAQPAYSPDGDRIAYRSSDAGSADIYVANADGTDPVRLTSSPAVDDSPSWSPDGQQIAFDSDRSGSFDIFSVQSDGSDVTRLTSTPANDFFASWAPDGRRIAFDRGADIHWMSVPGGEVRRLTSDSASTMPEWSPDGTRLAFVQNGQVAVMNADGTGVTSLGDGSWPAWESLGGQGDASIWFLSDAHVDVGRKVSLAGWLSIPGASSAGRVVTVEARPPGGAFASIGTTTSELDGQFRFTSVPHETGTWTYRVTWSEEGATPATFQATIEARKRVAVVAVALSDQKLHYGQSARVTARMEDGPARAVVSIYGQPEGRARFLVDRGRVDRHGTRSTTVRPKAHTTYWAQFAPTRGWTGDRSRTVRVHVDAAWTARARGGYATAGRYRLYHYSRTCMSNPPQGCPQYLFTLHPKHPGARVEFRFEYHFRGRWRGTSSTGELGDRKRILAWTWYRDDRVLGVPLRMRVRFPGDDDHGAASSAWVYAKVTR